MRATLMPAVSSDTAGPYGTVSFGARMDRVVAWEGVCRSQADIHPPVKACMAASPNTGRTAVACSTGSAMFVLALYRVGAPAGADACRDEVTWQPRTCKPPHGWAATMSPAVCHKGSSVSS